MSLVIHVLFFKKLFNINAKYEKLKNKMQFLKRYTNENQKSIHTEIDGFRTERTTVLHYENEEEWPNIIRKPSLMYLVTVHQ